MFINESELEAVLNRVDSGNKKSIPTHSLFYYPYSQIISSVRHESFVTEFSLAFKDRIFGSRKVPFKTSKKIIIRPVLNGFITVLLNENKLFKFVLRNLEPSFLANENKAALLIPEFVPQLLKFGKLGDYDYVVLRYISKKEWIGFNDWFEMFSHISEPIRNMHISQRKELKKINFKSYTASLMSFRRRSVTNNTYLCEIFKKNTDLYEQLLQKFNYKIEFIYRCFQHGDLTPNNVIRTDKNVYLIDFQNGGFLNIFYDLMIQDFYSPNNMLWKQFQSIKLVNNSNREVMKGWSSDYCKMIQSVYNIPINDNLVKVSVLLSLIELGNMNFLRYQSKAGAKEGLVIQKILYRIGSNILKS